MKIQCWLIVNDNGSVKVRKTKPDMRYNEVPVRLDINIPDELFEQPRLEASIDVPREAYFQQPLTAEVRDNVKDAIEQATNLNFDVTLTYSEEETELTPKQEVV